MEFPLLLDGIKGKKKMWKNSSYTNLVHTEASPHSSSLIHVRPTTAFTHANAYKQHKSLVKRKIKGKWKCCFWPLPMIFSRWKSHRRKVKCDDDTEKRATFHEKGSDTIDDVILKPSVIVDIKKTIPKRVGEGKCKTYEQEPWMLVSRGYDKLSSSLSLALFCLSLSLTIHLSGKKGKAENSSAHMKISRRTREKETLIIATLSIDWVTTIVRRKFVSAYRWEQPQRLVIRKNFIRLIGNNSICKSVKQSLCFTAYLVLCGVLFPSPN